MPAILRSGRTLPGRQEVRPLPRRPGAIASNCRRDPGPSAAGPGGQADTPRCRAAATTWRHHQPE